MATKNARGKKLSIQNALSRRRKARALGWLSESVIEQRCSTGDACAAAGDAYRIQERSLDSRQVPRMGTAC